MLGDVLYELLVNNRVEETEIMVEEACDTNSDSDDVFREGVGPPVPLAANLATPYPSKKGSIPGLPRWFSEDDDEQEQGGTQEPPATPVGKDELALRRHRFFSELMTAAQAAAEHRVSFDPLGPVVADGEIPFYAILSLPLLVPYTLSLIIIQVLIFFSCIITQTCPFVPSAIRSFTASITI